MATIQPDDSNYGGQTVQGTAWAHVNEDAVGKAAKSFEDLASYLRNSVVPAAQKQKQQLSDAWEGKGSQAALEEASAIISEHDANANAAETTASRLRMMEVAIIKTKNAVNSTANGDDPANNSVQEDCEKIWEEGPPEEGEDTREKRIRERILAGFNENSGDVSTNTRELAENLRVAEGTPGADGQMPETSVGEPAATESQYGGAGSGGVEPALSEPVSFAPISSGDQYAGAGSGGVEPALSEPVSFAPISSGDQYGGAGSGGVELPPPNQPATPAAPESPIGAIPPGSPAAPPAPPARGGPNVSTSSPSGGGPSLSSPSTSSSVASASSGSSAPESSGTTTDSAASTGQPQHPLTEFQKAMSEATKAAAAQQPFIPPTAAAGPAAAAPPPPVAPQAAPVEAAVQPAPTPTPPASPPPAAAGGGLAGGAPLGGAGVGGPAGSPMPLGPPPTPSPAAPVAAPGAAGPAVPPAAAAGAASGAVAAAPVPVSTKRAERDAVAGALRRASGSDPLEVARRVGAALNVGITEPRLFWMTGLTTDGSILVANNYGLGYIPEAVNLPEQVKFVSADESIPAQERGKWATYPALGLHGWAEAHDESLRAVIATEDQFKGTDPGAAAIVLQPDDLPADGRMEGRARLAVIAPEVAAKLATMSDQALPELLPPAPVDPEPPENRRTKLLMEVFRPLLSSDPGRAPVQLQAMITFATHMQELSLHRAHTATDVVEQRAAICDWIYWQHLSVLTSDAVGGS